jgi:hypothetical protein
VFRPEEFRHVMLDPQVAEAYLAAYGKPDEPLPYFGMCLPQLQYYPSLLNHALFIVTPMSSMLLEAALFDTPALVLAHDDGVNLIPPHLQARFRHFEGADEVPGWFFVREAGEIRRTFSSLLRRFQSETAEEREFRPILSAAMKRYLFHDGRTYAERLEEAVEYILASGLQAREPDPSEMLRP